MRIDIDNIVIRDFNRKDAQALYNIVREKGIMRFMRDWSDNSPTPESLLRSINRTKEEWINLFEQYFILETYDEFECDDEPKGFGRRMFGLRNNK